MNAASVRRRFESNRRQLVLSFWHHAEVAALPAREADRLLQSGTPRGGGRQARLSTFKLRGEVKRVRRGEKLNKPRES